MLIGAFYLIESLLIWKGIRYIGYWEVLALCFSTFPGHGSSNLALSCTLIGKGHFLSIAETAKKNGILKITALYQLISDMAIKSNFIEDLISMES